MRLVCVKAQSQHAFRSVVVENLGPLHKKKNGEKNGNSFKTLRLLLEDRAVLSFFF